MIFNIYWQLALTYQKIQIVIHIVKQATDHGRQVYHMRRLHFVKQCLRGSQIPKLFTFINFTGIQKKNSR